MANKIKVWFDAQADFLEVRFNDAVMERVDAEGRVIGFSILGVSRYSKEKTLSAELAAK